MNACYRAIEQHDMGTLLSFFSDSVDYRTDTMSGKAAVQDDYSHYFKRWPVASYSIGNVQVRQDSVPDHVTVLFNLSFSVRDLTAKRHKTGRREVTWKLEKRLGGYKITSVQEK